MIIRRDIVDFDLSFTNIVPDCVCQYALLDGNSQDARKYRERSDCVRIVTGFDVEGMGNSSNSCHHARGSLAASDEAIYSDSMLERAMLTACVWTI